MDPRGGGGFETGCMIAVLVVFALVCTVLVMVVGPMLEEQVADAQAQRAYAEAERTRAQAELEHVQGLEFRRDFMTWTAYIESQKSPMLIPLVGLFPFVGLCAVGVGYLIGRQR